MEDLKSLTLDELKIWMKEHGEPVFRAGQVYKWFHDKGVRSYDEMNNVPKSLKNKMLDEGEIGTVRIVDVQVSKDGTRKYLFALNDGELVESVWMEYSYGSSVCISSQVGCRMGCKFCASTLDGLVRGLKPSEMLDQIYMMNQDTGKRASHLVIMGTGEPFDNYDNLVKFLRILISEEGYNLSRRNITVSTCGIVPKIYEFADEGIGITLALSLHATTDEKRKEIMPIANKYSLKEIEDAISYFVDKTGRRVTFEYALAEGVNDTDEDARLLQAIAKPVGAHINLIPINPVTERGFKPTASIRVQEFKNKLENKGINVTIRRELGQDIDGACGQLRHRRLEDIQ